MGDKTQLLALILAARFKKPLTVMAGILVATLLNHWLASYVGALAGSHISPDLLKLILFVLFLGFALWILIPDKEDDVETKRSGSVFVTTTLLFFLAEMGDKTQLATIALGANYQSTLFVTIGTTLGMLFSNALAVFFGEKVLKRVPMKWVRRVAALLFALFAVGILVGF